MSDDLRKAVRDTIEGMQRQVTGHPKLRGAPGGGPVPAGITALPELHAGAFIDAVTTGSNVAKYDLSKYGSGEDYG